MPSILCVTQKPPITLIVAKITAIKPKIEVRLRFSVPAERIAPTKVIPDIALDPDIRGVCNMGGILVMISKPTKIAKTKMVNSSINSMISKLNSSDWMGVKTKFYKDGSRIPNSKNPRFRMIQESQDPQGFFPFGS